jgi:hypothetical protein
VPLIPGARLTDSSVISDTNIPVPFATELNVESYSVLTKKSYQVPLDETEVTAFYATPPQGWSLAHELKPTIWATDGGKRAVWILIVPLDGSTTFVGFDEGRVTE